jgi:hypothetical protein
MKTAGKILTVTLLLVSYLTPAMACMVSDVQMNAEERACCRAMQNQCEQMGMSTTHGCCQKAPHSTLDNALATKAITHQPVAIVAIWLTAADWSRPALADAGEFAHADYSPPLSPRGSISVLRI